MPYQVLTSKGKALQAKVEAEKSTLNLTRMAVGSGTDMVLSDYDDATALENERHSMLITGKEQSGGACIITAGLTSDAVDEGFTATELGLFAKDGEDEILYAVSLFEGGQYIPSKLESTGIDLEFTMTIAFSSDATISVTLPADQDTIIKRVQNDAVNAVNAATAAESSESSAKAAADRAETEAQNAALSESNAKASEESAKKTASSIADATAADVKTATEQAQSAAASAQSAQDAESTAQELYRRFCVDIVGPPASAMNDADLFVAPGAAAMAAMGR